MSVKSEQLPITSPCPITLDRDGTTPEDRRMHCAHCVKDVHLLSNMDEREARTFIAAMAGQDICVSYAIRPDGQIRFRDTQTSARPAAAMTRAATSSPTFVPASALTRGRARRANQTGQGGDRQIRANSPGGMLAGIGAAMMLAACAPHSDTGAIDTQEQQVVAPYQDGVIIPDQQPCDGPVQEVEGGLKAVPLPQDVQVDGGIEAVPLPEEIQVAGGMRAEPFEPEQFVIPEPVLPEANPDGGADAVEVHTPPAAPDAKVEPEPQHHLRGRIAPRSLEPDLG